MARRRSLKQDYQEKATKMEKEDNYTDFGERLPFLPKFQDGEKRYLRIIPEKKYGLFFLEAGEDDEFENPQYPYAEVWKHFKINSANNSVSCPAKMLGEECPVCDEVASLKESGDKDDLIRADIIRAQHKYIFFVVWRDHEDDGPYQWELSPKWGKDIVSILGNTDYEAEIDDPEEGYDLKVVRHGMDYNNTTYRIDMYSKSTMLCSYIEEEDDEEYVVLNEEKMKEWLEAVPDITEFGKPFLTLEQLTKLFNEEATMSDLLGNGDDSFNPEEIEKEEEEEKPKRRRRKRT